MLNWRKSFAKHELLGLKDFVFSVNGSRVILQDANNDYINASYVDVSWTSSFAYIFCSLLPLRCKLLCRPSDWESECNNRIRAFNELCRFRSDVPPTIFETSPQKEFSSEYFTEMLLRYIFGPSVVKYDVLSNNRRSSNPGQNCWDISMQFSMSRHATIVPRRNKLAPLPTPGAMSFRLNSSSMHFLCYHKQLCNGGGGKQSFNLRQ